ncbi:MAG: hypothetical protein ACOY9J_08615 [Pseudomonadota bacterium]
MNDAAAIAFGAAWIVLSAGAAAFVLAGGLWALFRRKPRYIYGRVFRPADGHTRDNVRLNTKTGRLEFVLWRAGEQGHAEDYWHNMGDGWEEFFIPNDAPWTPK